MKRKIFVGLVVAMLLVGTVGAFAASETKSTVYPWMASYNQPGELNLYAAVGFYGFGLDLDVGPEIMITKFDLAGIPLELGATVRGLVGFGTFLGYASWIDWGVAPMVTLHWGVDFGAPWRFDWYVGAGLSISGTTSTYSSYYTGSGVQFGFASSDGVAWHFSKNLALIVDYTYTYYISTAGVGIKLAL
jgi:hypothetical protein